jgi:hypothetical protein
MVIIPKDKLKFILILLLGFHGLTSQSQIFSENEIKALAEKVNQQVEKTDVGNGVICRGCLSLGRTIIYQYDVPDGWEPLHNIKDVLRSNLEVGGFAKLYRQHKMDASFYYYNGNNLIKRVNITYHDFDRSHKSSNDYPILGDYFETQSHPKAKDVNLKIKVPNGWDALEGERPNVVKKFVKDENIFLILIKDNATFFSRRQIKEAFKDKSFAKEYIDEVALMLINSKLIEQNLVSVDTYPTVYFKIKGDIDRAGVFIPSILSCWIIFYEDKLVIFQGISVDNENKRKLNLIYSMITNSAIFPEQYE